MKYLMILLLAISINANAESKKINIDLHDAPISDAIELAIKGLIGKNYIIEPDLKNSAKKITMQLKDIEASDALNHIQEILQENNIAMIVKEDIVLIKSADNVMQNASKQLVQNPMPTTLQSLNESLNETQIKPLENNQAYVTYQVKNAEHKNIETIANLFQLQVHRDVDLILLKGEIHAIRSALYLLKQFDRPIQDITVKCTVVEITNNNDSSWNFQTFLNDKKMAVKIGSASLLRDTLTITGATYSILLSQMTEDSRFNVLNTSTLRVQSGQTARINVGAEVPVLTSFTQQPNQPLQQSVEYRQSGLILDVTPRNTQNNITVDVMQQLSNFNQTTTSQINSPTLTKRELKTIFNAKFDEIIMLGGLDQNQNQKITNRLFGIPIGSSDKQNKSSLYLIIQFTRS